MSDAATGPVSLTLLVESMPAVTYVADVTERGRLLYISPQVEGMLGYPPAALRDGRPRWDQLIHPEDRPQALAQMALAASQERSAEESIVLTYRKLTRGGRYRWVRDHARSPRDGTGMLHGVVLDVTPQVEAESALRGARDQLETRILERTRELSQANARLQQEIAERRDAEQSLRHSEELYRLLAEHSTDMISKHTPQGQFLYTSPACRALLGYEPHELIGRNPYEIFHPDDLAAIRHSHDSILRVPDVYTVEYRIRRKDGTYTWFESTSKTIRDPVTGAVLEIISASRDISSRKEAEDERRLLHDELTHVARLTTLGEMASGLAHELNQPLAAISNYVEAAQRLAAAESADGSAAVRAMEGAVAEAQRAGEIIRRMRSMARRAPAHAAPADLNELVREVVVLCAAEARAAGAAVVLDLQEPLPPIRVDRVAIEQVLVNLVRNGLESMRDCASPTRVLTISTAECEAGLEAAVHDTGCGLSDEARRRMFDPFFTTKPDGLGMGLPISRTIVEAHGGRLWAERSPQGGTTFRFALPISGV
jgi:PAS domain S-box-containing protein